MTRRELFAALLARFAARIAPKALVVRRPYRYHVTDGGPFLSQPAQDMGIAVRQVCFYDPVTDRMLNRVDVLYGSMTARVRMYVVVRG